MSIFTRNNIFLYQRSNMPHVAGHNGNGNGCIDTCKVTHTDRRLYADKVSSTKSISQEPVYAQDQFACYNLYAYDSLVGT